VSGQTKNKLEILYVGSKEDRDLLRLLVNCGPVRMCGSSQDDAPALDSSVEYVGACRLPLGRDAKDLVRGLRSIGIPFMGMGDHDTDAVEIALAANCSAQKVGETLKLLREVCQNRRKVTEIAHHPVAVGLDDFVALIDFALNLRLPGSTERAARVAWYSANVGKALKMTTDELELLQLASRAREIGKLSLPDHEIHQGDVMLSDPTSLGNFAYPAFSSLIMRQVPQFTQLADVVACQLENFDGSGQSGLKGGAIPLTSRVLRAVAAFERSEALHGVRNNSESLGYLFRDANRIFDPEVLTALDAVVWQRDSGSGQEPTRMAVKQLVVGDWLGQCVYNLHGLKMIPYGHKLDWRTKEMTIKLLEESNISYAYILTKAPRIRRQLDEDEDVRVK